MQDFGKFWGRVNFLGLKRRGPSFGPNVTRPITWAKGRGGGADPMDPMDPLNPLLHCMANVGFVKSSGLQI